MSRGVGQGVVSRTPGRPRSGPGNLVLFLGDYLKSGERGTQGSVEGVPSSTPERRETGFGTKGFLSMVGGGDDCEELVLLKER